MNSQGRTVKLPGTLPPWKSRLPPKKWPPNRYKKGADGTTSRRAALIFLKPTGIWNLKMDQVRHEKINSLIRILFKMVYQKIIST